jgi:hypothetical protein
MFWTMKTYGGVEVSFPDSQPSHYMEVNGERDDCTVLPLAPIRQESAWAPEQVCALCRWKNSVAAARSLRNEEKF